jgi:hypothetical protein
MKLFITNVHFCFLADLCCLVPHESNLTFLSPIETKDSNLHSAPPAISSDKNSVEDPDPHRFGPSGSG